MNEDMTEEHYRFFGMLNNYQRISKFWSAETLTLDIKELQQELNQLSTGERHMAQFFASVWLNDSGLELFEFDLISAVRVLDESSIQIISKWLKESFFP